MSERLLSLQGQGDRGSIGGIVSEWTSEAGIGIPASAELIVGIGHYQDHIRT
jgi:hypothetical protein